MDESWNAASERFLSSDSEHPIPPVVAVGASAGERQALETFFSAIPARTGMAFVVLGQVGRLIGGEELIGGEDVLHVGQQQFLVLLLVIKPDSHKRLQPGKLVVIAAVDQRVDLAIDVFRDRTNGGTAKSSTSCPSRKFRMERMPR